MLSTWAAVPFASIALIVMEQGREVILSQKPDELKDIPPGTQDRLSLMMQLASLLGGNDQIDEKGTVREIPIANLDKLEIWRFQSQGKNFPMRSSPWGQRSCATTNVYL